jgi:hypothetical protein
MTLDQLDDLIDSQYDAVTIYGITFSASYILKKLDPIAYNCLKNDVEGDNDDDEGQP